jgi:hypothetical protein
MHPFPDSSLKRHLSFARSLALAALVLLLPASSGRGDPPAGDDLVAGYSQTCLRRSGAWECWGALPDTSYSSPPRRLRLDREIGGAPLALGSSHACALLDRGVACWGSDFFHQVGGGPGKIPWNVTEPVPGWRPRVTAVAAGYDWTCAALNDGLECIGGGRYGESPRAIAGMPPHIGRFYTNQAMACALDGLRLACFGLYLKPFAPEGVDTRYARVDLPPLPGPPSAVAIGGGGVGLGHACVIVDGAVWCWGDNFDWQRGDSSYDQRQEFRRVELPGRATAITAGGAHTCVLISGAVWCWGSNGWGQTGQPLASRHTAPAAVPGLQGVRAIAAGDNHTCAFDGTDAWCWGINMLMELGTATEAPCAGPSGQADTGPPEPVLCSDRPVRLALP